MGLIPVLSTIGLSYCTSILLVCDWFLLFHLKVCEQEIIGLYCKMVWIDNKMKKIASYTQRSPFKVGKYVEAQLGLDTTSLHLSVYC